MVLNGIPALKFTKLDKEVNTAFFFFNYNCVSLLDFKIQVVWISAENQYIL